MSTAEFFEYARGGFTIYTDKDGDRPADIRFVLARYGESPDLVLEAFWKEHSGDFLVLPMSGHGA